MGNFRSYSDSKIIVLVPILSENPEDEIEFEDQDDQKSESVTDQELEEKVVG